MIWVMIVAKVRCHVVRTIARVEVRLGTAELQKGVLTEFCICVSTT